MTAKEKIEVVSLLSSMRCAASNIKLYCKDYDSTELLSVASELEDSVKNFRKAVKL